VATAGAPTIRSQQSLFEKGGNFTELSQSHYREPFLPSPGPHPAAGRRGL